MRGIAPEGHLPPANHNYFWYESEHEDRVWLIPWDLDLSLRDVDYPPHIPVDWRVQPAAAECGMCRGGGRFGNGDGPPAGFDPIIRNFQAWQTRYEEKLDALLAGPLSKRVVDEQFRVWQAQITAAGFKVNETGVAELQAILERTRAHRGYPYP